MSLRDDSAKIKPDCIGGGIGKLPRLPPDEPAKFITEVNRGVNCVNVLIKVDLSGLHASGLCFHFATQYINEDRQDYDCTDDDLL